MAGAATGRTAAATTAATALRVTLPTNSATAPR
jgi:hypothetical protein